MKEISSSDIILETDRISDHQKSTFLSYSHSSKIVLMEEGDILWRFISKKNRNKFSDCWMDSTTMTEVMSIFRSWERFDEGTKKEVVRNNLAILDEWSMLNWRIKIQFKKPVIAYKGAIGPQKIFHEGQRGGIREARIGGYDQYVIPRFKGISDHLGEEFAEIIHFVHI